MTTEFVLLLGLFVFISAGAFFGENGPGYVFQKSGPRLGARLEKNITCGHSFNERNGTLTWEKPVVGGLPDGRL
jgi:hypothetical protein